MLKKSYRFNLLSSAFLLSAFLIFMAGCKDNPSNYATQGPVSGQGDIASYHSSGYKQVNLVSDVTGFNAARIDANLVNAWGITISTNGNFWLSANGTSLSVIYDSLGNQKRSPVTIPTATASTGGAPSGVVFNTTSDFKIPSDNSKALFIFAQEDGILSAWNTGTGNGAVKVADRSSSDAVYKGLAIGSIGNTNYIYAANFKGRSVDVFDKDFNYVSSITFHDNNIPSTYGPFNIANIDGYLYVTYAKRKAPDFKDDDAGPGNGYVDVYRTDGTLVRRFATRGHLNSPWGITDVPSGFGLGSHAILVGNFGDGRINIFSNSGNYTGQLRDSSEHVITIDGLWGLFFIPNGSTGPKDQLYFTAGPGGESHGIFGYLKKVRNNHHGHDYDNDND